MTRAKSSKSNSSASVNSKSDGRTTKKYVQYATKDGKFVPSPFEPVDVKGTSAGDLIGQVRQMLAEKGFTIPSEPPTHVDSEYTVPFGDMIIHYRVLTHWKQCPTCGATHEHATPGCPSCESSTELSDQDKADFKERNK